MWSARTTVALALACAAGSALGWQSGPRESPRLLATKRRATRSVACTISLSERGDGLPCGSLVAMVTPMDSDGRVDEAMLRAMIRWHIESQSDGLVVLGTTGEASVLSRDEKRQVMRITQEEASGKIPVIYGTGTISPDRVIEQNAEAAEFGADGVLVVTPYYVKPTQKGLVKHFERVADKSDVPIILYNVPGRSGVDMTPITAGQLSAHPRIVGLKEATGDVMRVAPLRELCGPNFLLYSGDDASAVDFVLAGGDGTISVTSNVAPAQQHEVMACARVGDAARARELNAQLELLHRRLFIQSNPIPVKWALEQLGRAGPGIRPPLTPLEAEFHTPLLEALDVAGVR